jgi:hypothetical protein
MSKNRTRVEEYKECVYCGTITQMRLQHVAFCSNCYVRYCNARAKEPYNNSAEYELEHKLYRMTLIDRYIRFSIQRESNHYLRQILGPDERLA